jgi:hypothetical protein
MRVVCPYTQLRPQTRDALEQLSPVEPDFVDVGGSHDSYFWTLARLWAQAETFVLVEHDIVVHPDVFTAFLGCRQPWCAFVYERAGNVGPGLGCTRFRRELMLARPRAIAALEHDGGGGVPARDWRRLDVRVEVALAGRAHLHRPPVTHLP